MSSISTTTRSVGFVTAESTVPSISPTAATVVPVRTATARPRRVRRSLAASVATLLSVAAIALGLTVTAPAAHAVGTSVISSNSGGANLRACAATSCRSLGWMPNGTNVQMRCYYDARQSTTGNYASPRWFLVWTTSLGATGGYVHSSLVARQTGVPRC